MSYCANKICYYYDPPGLSAKDKAKLQNIPCPECNLVIYCS